MINKEAQTEKKLRGGYYTPSPIADYLWEWVSQIKPKNLLEPSAGEGALLEPINYNDINIDAVELSKEEVIKLKEKRIHGTLNVFSADFFEWLKDNNTKKYDAIVSNPPYIRYQYLTEKQRDEQSVILKKNGMKPNRLINAWVAFVTASISILRDRGRIGLVIPADFLQVTYAKQLRQFIIDELSKINIVTFKKHIFPGTQQDFIILLGEKGKKKASLKYSISEDLYDLPNFDKISNIEVPDKSANKWSDLKLTLSNREYLYDLLSKTVSFKEVAKVEVGVTTGGNAIFSLTQQKVNELEASGYVTPLLGRSVDIQKLIFDRDTLNSNSAKGQKVWLLDLMGHDKSELPYNLKKYLDEQEKLDRVSAYKLRIRDKWYQIPGIWVSDAFILRRIGSLPKLIINEISAISTDTFHRVNFKNDVNPIKIIFAFYSSISLSTIELAGRSYGGGALEILPGDMEDIRLPKIDFKKDNCDLSKEFKILNSLFENNANVIEIAEYSDSVLNSKLNYEFDSKRSLEILNTLQSMRIGKN